MKNITIWIILSVSILLAACGESDHASDTKAVNAAPVQDNFAQITTRLSSPAYGGVDVINGVMSPKSGSVVTVTGEKIEIAGNYVDAVKGEAAAGVLVLIDDKPYVSNYGGERPDIAKALNNPKYLKSQFYVAVPSATVGAGLHNLKIRVIAADKSGYYESDLIAKLKVK